MSHICYCIPSKVILKESEGGGKYCANCGNWYMPEHGSGQVRTKAVSHKSATGHKTGRNDPCPCGSNKKHKRCCLNKRKVSQ